MVFLHGLEVECLNASAMISVTTALVYDMLFIHNGNDLEIGSSVNDTLCICVHKLESGQETIWTD